MKRRPSSSRIISPRVLAASRRLEKARNTPASSPPQDGKPVSYTVRITPHNQIVFEFDRSVKFLALSPEKADALSGALADAARKIREHADEQSNENEKDETGN